MNLYDFLIIYLACGAPFGVYYFLQNRKMHEFEYLRLKSILNFLFWLPSAVRLLRKNGDLQNFFRNNFGGERSLDAKTEKNICLAQKRLEKIFLESRAKLSIYEFREIINRYVGLTVTSQFEHKTAQTARTKNDLFQISGHKNNSLAAVCLERRNRKRLLFHQRQARVDFLKVLAELFDSGSDRENLETAAIEFATLLNDAEALGALEKLFKREAQTGETANVKNAETEIWKTEARKPLLVTPNSTRLKALTAAMNLRAKD
ncbi:MAG TPA: hypothetical protein VGC76_00225 [Pyrinomonadaceae bacterium]|jgi:hypothetical protein